MEKLNDADETKYFILDCQARLQRILERLNWNQQAVISNFNTNSLASLPKDKNLPKQIEATKGNVFPPSCWTKNGCVLATPELQKLLKDDSLKAPNNFHELQANFTREQKLRIYEHVIQNTKTLEDNAVEEVPAGEQSLADIVAENKREANRKKRKFRISKPTRTEEVRSMIDLQMKSLQQFIEKQKKNNCNKSISSLKDKQANFKDKSPALEPSRKTDNESCNYRNQETSKKYGSHRTKETIESPKSIKERDSSRKTYCKTNTIDLKIRDKKYYDYSRKRSPSNSSSSRKNYQRHHKSRSKSPDSRNRKCFRSNGRERDVYNSHSKKRDRSQEYDWTQRGRERAKREKSDKITEGRRSNDRHHERRSRSKGKHSHHKKKQKKLKSRSKSRDLHARDDSKRKRN